MTPISGPVPLRAGGVIRPPSIAGGLPGAHAPEEPSAVCSCCIQSCVALPISLLPTTMRKSRYMAYGRLRLHAAGNCLALVEQLLGTAQLADDLLGVVAFAFHGASPGQLLPIGKLS